MASIPQALEAKCQRDPDAPVDLIVRLTDDPSIHLQDLQSLGWTVKRTFSLTPSVALTGPASACRALATKPWVASIEEDRPVHTM